MALSLGCNWTSTVQVNSDAEAVVEVTVSSHRTDAATGMRCRRYTVLAAEYISTSEGSVRTAR
jgi:hypothetical protein